MIQENELQILGLNKYEAEAYKSLIRLGKASSVEISHDSNVPYGRIYDTLGSLVSKRLVKVIPEKSKKFAPSDPEILDEILKKKFEELNQIKGKIASLKKSYSEKEEEKVWIVKGRRNFYRAIKDLPLKTEEEFSIRYTVDPMPEWIRSKKFIKNTKSLVRVDSETKDNILKWKEKLKETNFRQFENEGISMDIRDKFVWIKLNKPDILIIIQDESFTKVMKKLFLNTYNVSKEV